MKKKNKIIGLSLATLLIVPNPVFALKKSETIYANLDYKGINTKTSVSNHLSFIDKNQLEDDSELKNILNIGGLETFTSNGTKLTWNTDQKDIYYTGDTESELPIDVSIKYFLNEEELDAKDILGSAGKIKIQISFKNKEEQTVTINGKRTTIYTPFVTTIGTIINSNANKDISVSNGKVVSTGNRNMVVGLASPGLYESLGLEEFKNLNQITIEYTTTKFELNNIYIVSTPKLLEKKDLEIFNKMDNLYSNVSELQKNMNILENGIIELANGITQINNGSTELVNSLKSAVDGTKNVKEGATSLHNGLKEISLSLKNAKKELENTDTSSIKSIETLKSQNNIAIEKLIATTKMSKEELTTAYETYNLKDYKGTDPNLLALKNAYEIIYLLETNNQALTTTTASINTLTKKLSTLINTLDSAIEKLEKGSSTLTSGITTLQSGIEKIYAGSKTLKSGTEALNKGATTLKSGAKEFNKQGIGTLSDYAYTLKTYSDKAEALVKLSEEYNGFASNNSDETIMIEKVEALKLNYRK